MVNKVSVHLLNKFLKDEASIPMRKKKRIRYQKSKLDTSYQDIKRVSMDALQKWSGLSVNKI